MDTKTFLILAGLAFILWSCGGTDSAPTATTITPAESKACYQANFGAWDAQWPQMSVWQRATVSAKILVTCEEQP